MEKQCLRQASCGSCLTPSTAPRASVFLDSLQLPCLTLTRLPGGHYRYTNTRFSITLQKVNHTIRTALGPVFITSNMMVIFLILNILFAITAKYPLNETPYLLNLEVDVKVFSSFLLFQITLLKKTCDTK